MFLSSNQFPSDSLPMSVAYLEKLNPEQRRAVEHGVREKACAPSAPLLVLRKDELARPPRRAFSGARMHGMWR
jgi:hypothetical protein